VLDSIRPLLTALRGSDKTPGQELKSNELLSNVRQRISIPAGACSFDVPAYQFWLEQPPGVRDAHLREWLGEFGDVREAVELCLTLIRESARATREQAAKGFFQRSLDPNVTCQMVRVVLPPGLGCFPEISGGKHRFTIRFLNQHSPAERPAQTEEDVDFELQCCVI
jgi:cell division protein ZapD